MEFACDLIGFLARSVHGHLDDRTGKGLDDAFEELDVAMYSVIVKQCCTLKTVRCDPWIHGTSMMLEEKERSLGSNGVRGYFRTSIAQLHMCCRIHQLKMGS
jgi:hypothetical protein